MKWVISFFDNSGPRSLFIQSNTIEEAIASVRNTCPGCNIIAAKIYM